MRIARVFVFIVLLMLASASLADDWEIVVSDGECELWTLLKYHDVDADLCRLASVLSDIITFDLSSLDIAYQSELDCSISFYGATRIIPEIDPVLRAIRDGSSPLLVHPFLKDSEGGKVVKTLKEAEPDELVAALDEHLISLDYDGFCAELVMLTSAKWQEWLREHFPGNTVEFVSRSSYRRD